MVFSIRMVMRKGMMMMMVVMLLVMMVMMGMMIVMMVMVTMMVTMIVMISQPGKKWLGTNSPPPHRTTHPCPK